jgi:hypothetical protein
VSGIELSSTLVFDYPNAEAVASHLLEAVGEVRGTDPGEAAGLLSDDVEAEAIEEIAAMDVDDLVQRTLERQVATSDAGGGR